MRQGAPLVILLHGYTASGSLEELYLNITAESNKRGFLYAHPDGTTDSQGNQFWNATDACCNFEGSKVDDSAYISTLIKDVQAAYNVDAKRIYLIGHSNGAFMSYRMACEHGDQIAAFASLAGAMYSDVTKCAAKEPVSLLEIHGTADDTIAYEGGTIVSATYPSAATSVADWVTFDKCNKSPDAAAAPSISRRLWLAARPRSRATAGVSRARASRCGRSRAARISPASRRASSLVWWTFSTPTRSSESARSTGSQVGHARSAISTTLRSSSRQAPPAAWIDMP